MRAISVAFAFLLSAATATAQLGPETPVTTEPAQYPATIRAANHQLTAWTHPTTFEIRALLDGMPLSVGRSHEFGMAPVLAAGDSSFLIVWLDPEQSMLFARRLAFDGSFLDAAPIAIGPASYYTMNGSIAAAAEGADYLVWWATEHEVTVTRLTGNTSMPIGELPWQASFGTPQIRTVDVPGQKTRVFYGDNRLLPNIICDPVSCWNGSFGTVEPNGAGSIRSTEIFSDAYQAGPIAVVSDGSRFTLLWWGTRHDWTQAIFAAQLSLALDVLTPPKVVYETGVGNWELPPGLRAAWNGTEIVVAWSSFKAFRAIRLTGDAAALDPQPFDIAAPGDSNAPPSVTATDSGVLFTYASW
ncbi:MAG TPA: hypothetical protein VGR95_00535, partial [Thermoanaerobaculia bacterium]|nr:hypothetical protein [Thermoanaerobaculia bacterium]